MTRPTTEQVEGWIEELRCLGEDAPLYQFAILGIIDEVQALREEAAQSARYQAELSVCQGDRDEWRRNYDVASAAHEAAELRIIDLREQLERALRGQP